MSEFIAPLSRLKNLQPNGMPYPSLADVLKVKRDVEGKLQIVDTTDHNRFVDKGMPTGTQSKFAKGGYTSSTVLAIV